MKNVLVVSKVSLTESGDLKMTVRTSPKSVMNIETMSLNTVFSIEKKHTFTLPKGCPLVDDFNDGLVTRGCIMEGKVVTDEKAEVKYDAEGVATQVIFGKYHVELPSTAEGDYIDVQFLTKEFFDEQI